MSREKTSLDDVDYYLPLYDEDGDLDPEAYYHRNRLGQGRDFAHKYGLAGISDYAADCVCTRFPEIEDAAGLTEEIRKALIDLGMAIDQSDPENPATEDRIEATIATIRTFSFTDK